MSERLPTRLPEVTPRQREVARLIAEGYTNERIAQELGITHDGAKYHVSELLGRLGFERREEVAAWYQAQERRPLRERMRTLVGMPLAWGAGGVAAIAAVVLLIAAFEGALGGGADEESEIGISVPDGTVIEYLEHSTAGWSVRAASDIGERDLLFFLYSAGFQTAIHAHDRWTGELVGEMFADFTPPISAGNSPLFAYRRGAAQLIVSELAGTAPGGSGEVEFAHRLLIFDVSSGLTLTSEIWIDEPGGPAQGHGHQRLVEAGQLLLSADERYLYFVADLHDESFRGSVIRIVDLDAGPRVVATAALPERDPVRCGRDIRPALSQSGESSVLAMCPIIGKVRTIAPDGNTGPDVDVGGYGALYGFDDWGELPLASAIEGPAGLALLYADGTYGLAEAGDVTITGRALPENRHVFDWINWRGDVMKLDDVRLLISYRPTQEGPRQPDPYPSAAGLVIFNTDTMAIEHDVEIEHRGAYPIGNDEILLVLDGRVEILTTTTMDIDREFAATPGWDDIGDPDSPDFIPMVR